MRYLVWGLRILVAAIFFSFLHYTLPQHDIVRITGTYEERIGPGENSLFWVGSDTGNDVVNNSRDVFFIQTRKANGRVMVYRNEDTGWGWPPYFKFDTANLQAEAVDAISTAETPQWFAVMHYGWRFELASAFPNAISIRPIEGPDTRVIPWVSVIILIALAASLWAIRARWIRFRERKLNPVIDEWTDGWG
ncbi:MAG: DUF1523 family protein [Pseudomonadota bacterium]